MREGLHNEVILAVFLLFVSIFLLLLLSGCELRENAVIREQTDIFTDEIRDKNKDIQLLANKLEVAEENIKTLEAKLLCREELIDEAIDQTKKDALRENPVLISINKNPQKSNKAQAERENK